MQTALIAFKTEEDIHYRIGFEEIKEIKIEDNGVDQREWDSNNTLSTHKSLMRSDSCYVKTLSHSLSFVIVRPFLSGHLKLVWRFASAKNGHKIYKVDTSQKQITI